MDSVSLGQTSGSKVGRRIYLPAFFLGGPRDMRRRYLDAIALVQKYGKPDIFLTMTCNPLWPEIQENLKYKEKPQDRPDLLARVFRAKFEMLKAEIITKKIFGDVAAYAYVIEFQKRGFPHAHLLLILKPQFKPLNPEAYDKIVSAELPDRKEHPHLYSLVVRHMIHGPCGQINKNSSCHDLVNFHIIADETPQDVDETKEFQRDRWVSPPEALWRIYAFRLNEMTPAVYSLQVHLPGHQYVSFNQDSDLSQLLEKIDFSKTMLTEYFRMNHVNKKAQNLKCLYKDFAQHFVWTPAKRKWTERSKQKVIGRLVTVKPSEGDRYYLRLLLSHVRAPTSFDDLLTVNGCKLASFRAAALELGLLDSDSYIEATLEEAAGFQMPSSLRFLFAILLLHCAPTNPSLLSLQHIRRHISEYRLVADDITLSCHESMTKVVDSEKSIVVSPKDLLISSKLNAEQKHAYDLILQTGYIAIAVATLGVAASILPRGRTAHSRFKIPLDFSRNKTCQLSKQSSMAHLIIQCKLFLWDEASMAKKKTIEAFDELLKNLMETADPFGVKVVVFGGDFRQTLPVI
ncbi:uncharacterized protein [Coffea arabica]|uniref:ATP-dependent DNA helicase n=1 Tax=Coffea arabica TaxID=13443 RepID=A0A6P6TV20_COFAR